MINNVWYFRLNSICGNYAHEYLQILFSLNIGDVSQANSGILWK